MSKKLKEENTGFSKSILRLVYIIFSVICFFISFILGFFSFLLFQIPFIIFGVLALISEYYIFKQNYKLILLISENKNLSLILSLIAILVPAAFGIICSVTFMRL